MYLTALMLLLASIQSYDFLCDSTNSDWKRQPRLRLNQIQILAPTAHGFPLIVDNSDQMVSNHILNEGSWDPHLIYLLSRLVRKADTVLNLGSHVGLEAIVLGKLAGPTGQLYIFEPYSVSYRIMLKNVWLHNLEDNSRVYQLAAGSNSSTQTLVIDHQNTGHSHIESRGTTPNGQEVQIRRIDDVLPNNTKIDLLLIDVETMEVEALLGMKGVIERSSKLVALIEWNYLDNPERNEQQAKDLLEWLRLLGFRWSLYREGADPCQMGKFQHLVPNDLLYLAKSSLLLVGPDSQFQTRVQTTNQP